MRSGTADTPQSLRSPPGRREWGMSRRNRAGETGTLYASSREGGTSYQYPMGDGTRKRGRDAQ